MAGTKAVADNHSQQPDSLDSPLVVLTVARSGSTLLRRLLDSHPEIACPPETNIVKTCVKMGSVWKISNGVHRLPSAESAMIREATNAMFANYLSRRGKVRWCDKSLGSVEDAEEFLEIFPNTKFICLYRHCMDMVYSGLEACPWGVAGYGFDPYVSNNPGNNAAALAHYWADHTAGIADFEQAHPDVCLRVNYEALVADTKAVVDELADFLGTPKDDWAWSGALQQSDESVGAADYKTWARSSINTKSVGRGTMIPLGIMPSPLLGAVNQQLERVNYRAIGPDWNGKSRLSVLQECVPEYEEPVGDASKRQELVATIWQRIKAGLGKQRGGRDTFKAANDKRYISISVCGINGDDNDGLDWLIDLANLNCVQYESSASVTDEIGWSLIGDADSWLDLLSGRLDFAVGLRKGNLRILNNSVAVADREGAFISLAAGLLDLS